MNPGEYFSDHYINDLRLFAGGSDMPTHGPFGLLCGLTIGMIFEPNKIGEYSDPVGFLCSLYALNLLNQGIYTYFPEYHSRWLSRVAPFVDVRTCYAGHGGFYNHPDAIIRFARNPSYIPRAKPMPIDDQLGSYVSFFLNRYLPDLMTQGSHGTTIEGDHHFTSSALTNRLMRDPDCTELQLMHISY